MVYTLYASINYYNAYKGHCIHFCEFCQPKIRTNMEMIFTEKKTNIDLTLELPSTVLQLVNLSQPRAPQPLKSVNWY